MKLFNSTVARSLPYMPKAMVRIVSKKYLAGENISDAISTTQQINSEGATCTIDLLGEFVKSPKEVADTVSMYKKILEKIHQDNVISTVSLKPTSFGALLDEKTCFENIKAIVSFAKEHNNSVAIDMEDHPYTDLTLNTYMKLKQEFPENISTVLQAYMKRTLDDIDRLTTSEKCNFRLCKGIYKEPENIAYKDRNKINQNYLEALELLFTRKAFVGIATHDDYLVDGAMKLIEKYKLTKENYEFQMLLGVRSELRKKIVDSGYPLRIYVPFGKKWYEYSLRRLKENPDIVSHVIKGFITFGR